MNRAEFTKVHRQAKEIAPKRTADLDDMYATTDMPWHEYTAHLKLIAEGDE
jgi:hypothetical protein